MRGQSHSEEIKAAAIAALLSGESVTEIARRFDLPRASVNNWKRGLSETDRSFLELTPVNQKKEEFSDLIATYLRKSLHALIAQSERFGDRDWIAEQSAADLALLHGISCDKVVRLLEAAERAAELHTVRMVERSYPEGDDPSLP